MVAKNHCLMQLRGNNKTTEISENTLLEDEGFDIEKGQVAAFSALGWFADPIYSSMLDRSKPALCELFFHEITHQTVWFADQGPFNENLASFVSSHLTKSFLQEKGLKKELLAYLALEKDQQIYQKWLSELKAALNHLYSQSTLTKQVLLTQKATLFKTFLTDKKPRFNRYDLIDDKSWNNATVIGASLYVVDFSPFQRAFTCSEREKIGDFIQDLILKRDYEKKDPYLILKTFCPEDANDTRKPT